MSAPLVDWIWWATGVVVGSTGVTLAGWALVIDRARGRRRCPRCWYDLSGATGLTCSECGRTVRKERHLRRTRRRWRWAALALLVAVGGLALALTPKVRRDGWLSLVPPRGLVHAWVFVPEFNATLWNEMVQRPDFYEPHWDLMIDRCITGDLRARPISEAWKAKYGEILRRNIPSSQGHERDPELQTRWDALPPQVHIKLTSPWPEGVPVITLPQVGTWWRHPVGCNLYVTRRGDDRTLAVRIHPFENLLVLPPLEAGRHELVFDVRRERVRYRDPRVGGYTLEDLGFEEIRRTIEIRGTIDDYVEPVDDPAITDALDRFFDPRVVWMGGDAPFDFTLAFSVAPTLDPAFKEFTIALAVELVRHGEVVGTSRMAWPGGPTGEYTAYHPRHMTIEGDRSVLRTADFGDGTWSFRVRGDAAMAMYLGGSPRYWSGSFTAPALFVDRSPQFRPSAEPWPGPPQSLRPSVP